MTPETLLFIAGLLLLPAGAWAVAVLFILRDIKKSSDILLAMHRDPDRYGFGTGGFKEGLSVNTRAMHQLAHYVRWSAEQSSGKTAPPFVDKMETGK